MLFLKSILLIFSLVSGFSKPETKHDFHTSLTEMRLNSVSNSYEITIRVFTDDLQKALRNNDLETDAADKAVEGYFKKHFALLKGKDVRWGNYIGKEVESDVTWLYLELPKANEVKEFQLLNTIFMEMFDDQSNLLNVISGEERKTLIFNAKSKLQNFPA
jgi:hypothetical protein